ncbi:MAG: hypothetical protein ACOCRC_02970 [Halodesulfurarchaeum sp.]
MTPHQSRRVFLGTVGLSVVPGCISDESSQSEDETTSSEESDTDRTTEECNIETGSWQGEADPISTVTDVEQKEDTEKRCAKAAAEAAFDELQNQLDIDIKGEEWAGTGITYDGEYTPAVMITATLNRDGSVERCPDTAFDVATARSHLPAKATVRLEFTESEESFECTHEIELQVIKERLE